MTFVTVGLRSVTIRHRSPLSLTRDRTGENPEGGVMKHSIANAVLLSCRHFLAGAGGLGLAGLLGASIWPARAGGLIELPFANGRRVQLTTKRVRRRPK
jgi:hypothetical protein